MNLGLFSNRIADAIQHGERALQMARELGLREQLAYIVNDLARVYLATGQPEQSLELSNEASRLWRELGNLPMLTDSLSSSAGVLFFSGQYEQSLALANEALELSRSIHSRWGESYSQFNAGPIYWDQGNPSRAIATLEFCVRLSEESGFAPPQFYTRADLAWVYGSLGAVQHGISLARRAVSLAEMQMPPFRPHALARLATLHVWNGNLAEAEKAVDSAGEGFNPAHVLVSPAVYEAQFELAMAQDAPARALQVAEEFNAHIARTHTRSHRALALYLKGEALVASGRSDEAREVYSEAYRVAESLGQRRLMWPLLLRLAKAAALHGQADQSVAMRRQAREIVMDIASHTPDEWRASFQALPVVQAALESL